MACLATPRLEKWGGLSPPAYRERVVRLLFDCSFKQVIPIRGKRAKLKGWQNRFPTIEQALSYARAGNIGLVCGPVVVLDVDFDNGGCVEDIWPATWTVRTGSGGLHFLYRVLRGFKIRNSVGKLRRGVDVKSMGGCIVLPGSIHPRTGEMYRWLPGHSPGDLPLAEFPVALAELLSASNGRRPVSAAPKSEQVVIAAPTPPRIVRVENVHAYAESVIARECAAVCAARDGQRNNTLHLAAFNCGQLLVSCGIDPATLQHRLLGAAYECGLSCDEAIATIQSGLAASMTQPRQIEVNSPTAETPMATLNSSNSFNSLPRETVTNATSWSASLREEAFYGLAGDVVRMIEPHSESDPAALLLNFLTAFGNAAGRGSYFLVESCEHAPRLFVLLVGDTSKSRKGTSWGPIRKLMRLACPDFKNFEVTGLSSGEGLIARAAVEVATDTGERIMVVEPEFASMLKVMSRDCNTLSPVLRSAWDGEALQVLTRNEPLYAANAHISVLGHITVDELKRYLTTTEMANGLANRFLFMRIKRSKLLPEGGNLTDAEITAMAERVKPALAFARTAGVIKRDNLARELWASVYPSLSDGLPGMLGAVTARAEAQAMRIALIFALLDKSTSILEAHLRAALAVWHYAFAGARCIFGNDIGDPIADEILRVLSVTPTGMSRTEINAHFQKNRSGDRLGSALSLLQQLGHVRVEKKDTGGRPEMRYFYVKQATK